MNKDSMIDFLESLLSDEDKSVVQKLKLCKTPIEEEFYKAIVKLKTLDLCDRKLFGYLTYRIVPQKEEVFLVHRGNFQEPDVYNYKINIAITVRQEFSESRGVGTVADATKYAIMIDSDETQDIQRERNLMKLGYTVIRFAESEIQDEVEACAKEAMKIIKERAYHVDQMLLVMQNNREKNL